MTSAEDFSGVPPDLPCEPPSLRVLERLDEPIHAPGVCCVHGGSPCILFDDWDYAEDWSGEFVRVITRPETLTAATRVSTEEFWALVRQLHS